MVVNLDETAVERLVPHRRGHVLPAPPDRAAVAGLYERIARRASHGHVTLVGVVASDPALQSRANGRLLSWPALQRGRFGLREAQGSAGRLGNWPRKAPSVGAVPPKPLFWTLFGPPENLPVQGTGPKTPCFGAFAPVWAPRGARRAARKRPFSLVAGLTRGPFRPPGGPEARRAARKLASKGSLSRGSASETPVSGPRRAPGNPPCVGHWPQKTQLPGFCAGLAPPGSPPGGPKTAVFSCGRPYKGAVSASGRPRGPPGGPKTGLENLPE